MPVKNTYAWLFALAPLLSILVFAYGALTHDPVPDALIKGGFIGLYIGVASADVMTLRAAGVVNPPNRWWSILAPAYLIARALRLERGWNFVAFWFVAFAVAIPMSDPTLLGAQFAQYAPTPACDGMDADVLHIFGTIPDIRAAKVTGTKVTGQTQTAKVGAKRFCQAHVQTDAPDGKGADISYSVDRRDDGQLFLLIRLRQ